MSTEPPARRTPPMPDQPLRPLGPPRRPPGRVWPALLALAVVFGITGVVALGTLDQRGGRDLPPAPASAPPDTGLAVPPVRVEVPGRPQDQLAGWAGPLAERLEIPQPALEAYGYAAAVTAQRDPDCALPWTVLAGIGAIESSHGRFGGAELDDGARSIPPIRGLPLDGRPGIREIRDTDGGSIDGDPVHDRAVGAMQFIPTTWERYGVDADGDGVADPDDLDDAALAAAGYLCASGTELASADGWWRAVLTYNRRTSYGQDVLDRAHAYGRSSRAA